MPGFAIISLLLYTATFFLLPVQAHPNRLGPGARSTASVADVARSLVGDARPFAFSEDTVSIPYQPYILDYPEPGAHETLIFNVSIAYTEDLSHFTLWFDHTRLNIGWIDGRADSRQRLLLRDSTGTQHGVEVSWRGSSVDGDAASDPNQLLNFWFSVQSVTLSIPEADHNVDLVIVHRPQQPSHLIRPSIGGWFPASMHPLVDSPDADQGEGPPEYALGYGRDPIELDLTTELETLRLLEDQAVGLQEQIAVAKRVIAANASRYEDRLRLKQLKKQCDRAVDAARDVLQSIYKKVGISTDSSANQGISRGFTGLRSGQSRFIGQAALMKLSDPAELETIAEEEAAGDDDVLDLPSKLQNPVVQVLALIAAALGLTALAGFIHRRCMSMRRRVERAADREEWYNARAYRRAARRAEMRRRWDNFKRALSCFGRSGSTPILLDYDEKRALILQDAYLEQDADLAEKGEIMEAEIRELRHAHDIVAGLVRVDENHFTFVRHPLDPPPPLAALPQTSTPRSRASTGTLPSYSSEPLPDYSSARQSDSASSCGDDWRHGVWSSGEQTQSTALTTPPLTEGSSRCTPESSVRDVSPRRSFDTLYTRTSRSEV